MASKKNMSDYKILTRKLYPSPKRVQELIPIFKIGVDGVFQLEDLPDGVDKLYDKAYLFEDANFATMDDYEKEGALKRYCRLLNSMGASFKIVIMNNSRDMEKMRRDLFLRCADTRYKDIVKSINDHVEESVQKNGGIVQARLFVITCRREDERSARDYFRSIEANLVADFKSLGSVLIPLNAVERLRYLHAFYHLGHEADFDFTFEDMIRKHADWKDYISPRMVRQAPGPYGEVDGQTLQIDERYVRALYLPKMPNAIDPDMIRKIAGGSYHVILTIDVEAIPTDVARKKVSNQLLRNGREIERQQETRNKAWAWSSDISYDKRREKDELEGYLDIMNDNNEKFFYVGLYAVISSSSRSQLENDVLSFLTVAEGEGFSFVPAYFEQIEAVDTALPVGVRHLGIMRAMFTQPLSALTPFVVSELCDKGGIFYGINQVSKNVLFGDRKLIKNGNGFILGVSGSGKGMYTKLELIQVFFGTNDVIIIIDPQNEYKEIASYLGGQFIDFGAQAEHYINPLDTETMKYMNNKRNFLSDKMDLMNGIFSQILEGEIRSEYKTIITRCVMQLYEHMDEKGYQVPTLKDFYDALSGMDEVWAGDLMLNMERFLITGLDMFAKPTNVNINNRFVVFGLGNLGKEQSGIGTLIMLENIRSRIVFNSRRGISTRLYIDEFHNLARDRFSSAYLDKIWREVRKQGGLCTAITQDITDALSSKTVQAMLHNSDFTALLCQHEAEMEILGNVLGISDTLLSYVDNSFPGCGLLKFGEKYIPMDARMPKDSLMYQLFNTNFHEKVRGRKLKKKVNEELGSLPEKVQSQAALAPTDQEGVFPYPDETFKGEV